MQTGNHTVFCTGCGGVHIDVLGTTEAGYPHIRCNDCGEYSVGGTQSAPAPRPVLVGLLPDDDLDMWY